MKNILRMIARYKNFSKGDSWTLAGDQGSKTTVTCFFHDNNLSKACKKKAFAFSTSPT